MEILGRRFDTDESVRVVVEHGQFAAFEPVADAEGLPWLAPGFVDLQVNGYGGIELTGEFLSPEQVAEVCHALAAHGVTSFLPTVTTHSREQMTTALRTIAAACDEDEDVAAQVAGIHVEGPYLSPEDGPRGAHPAEHCRRPNWVEFQSFQQASGGRITLLTLAPELEGALHFIEQVVASGVTVAIGHTSASPELIEAAVDAGARLSTHLGNGSHPLLPRHRNYIWAQLAEDELSASLIADGHHLPLYVLKAIVRAKSPERCLLVSDVTGMAGMEPGVYENSSLGSVEVLADGKLIVAGQSEILAGASFPIGRGIQHIMLAAQLTFQQAVNMATRTPADLIGLPAGRLEVGAPADLVLMEFDVEHGRGDLEVLATIKGGRTIHGSLPAGTAT